MSAEDELQRVHSILGRATEDEAPHDAAWRVKAENERLRGALERIADSDPAHFPEEALAAIRSLARKTLTDSEEAGDG